MPSHRRLRAHRRLAAFAAAGALALAACTADANAPEPTGDTGASALPATPASATPSPSEDAFEAFPDRPASQVDAWPDPGDFLVDVTKAVVPAATLAQQERWDDYDHMGRITGTAQARWIGSWSTNDAISNYAHQVYTAAAAADRIGLIAYYGMRDYTCEEAASDPELADFYAERSRVLVEELPGSGAQAWIVLEPALVASLGSCEGDPRGAWVADAAATFADAGAAVYLDAGVVDDPAAIAASLASLDLESVAGIAVGTNGYRAVSEQLAAGEAVLAALADAGVDVDAPRSGPDPGEPGLGLIVDTSRSAVPVEAPEPCNPPEAGIGVPPRLVGAGALDAYVWIKRVGESDGACNGGPTRGQFSQALALQLARNGSLEES
ncbi:glycoside hydrolase family 6 protein [Demequina activiva]|uniref:Glucanase n=1 Tax=Demequina activiva TaxID=1582364 RepID=A0A919Q0U4_9MICO|nr:glycoside hydrolase family 6 protein [Demequina activiva]GIG53944.1 glucanase [Demequina activiva]